MTGPVSAADQQALLTLTVNTTRIGEVPVLFRDDELFVRVHDLEDTTRMRIPVGSRLDFAGDTYVMLASLAPEITFEYSEEKLRVDVTAPPTLFGTTSAQMAATKPEGFRISTDASAYLNYAFESVDFRLPSAVVETGFSLAGKYLFQTSISRSDSLGFNRGLTSLNVEDHDRLTRLTVGDGVAASTPLGGGGIFGGLTYRRDYAQDPYYIHRPDQLITGLATTPSTAKVYVNGVMVRQTKLPTGPYELHNLAIPSGDRSVEVVVTDAFGRESRTATQSYIVPTLLTPGAHDYGYTLGMPRLGVDPLHPLAKYGAPALLGAHRYGLTDRITLGGRFEAGRKFVSLGPGVTYGTSWGQFDLDAGLSFERSPGGALAFSYSYSATRYSYGVLARLTSPNYATTSLRESMDRTTLQVQPYAAYQLSPSWGLGVSVSHTQTREGMMMTAVQINTGLSLTQGLSVLLGGNYLMTNSGQGSWGVTLGLGFAIGAGHNARVVATESKNGPSTTVSVDKSLPVGDGFGYRVEGVYGSTSQSAGGLLQYQGTYGRFEGEVLDRFDEKTGSVRHRLNYAGGVAMVNGYVKAGRPIQDAFGIIKVAELENVRVKVSNGLIGTTGADGTLLLPSLLPYYGNQVEIVTEDIPVDRNIEVLSRLAVPARRSGSFLDFRAPKVFGISGTIRPQMTKLPVDFGPGELTVTVSEKSVEAVVGRHGEFYLEDVPPGTYEAQVEFPNIVCRATLQIPTTEESFVGLGEVPCVLK